MFWKSLVSAGLLCIVASPAFATPALTAVPGGTVSSSHLNAAGDWVWNVKIAVSSPVPQTGTGGTPLAAELGIAATGSVLKTASNLSSGALDDFDTANPGQPIYGWENLTDVGGGNMKPVGLQSNCAGGLCTEDTAGDDPNTVYAALGSIKYNDTAAHDFIQITTARPVTASAAVDSLTTLTVSGSYTGKGRISELNPDSPPDGTPCNFTSCNYDTFSGAVTRRARGGDANLDGTISGADYSALLANFNPPGTTGKRWQDADFNGDGLTTGADYSQLLANFGAAHNYSVGAGGAFAGAAAGASLESTSVPEPASVALLALAGLGVAGLRFRRPRSDS